MKSQSEKKRKYSLFITFIASYFAVLIIPLIILGLFVSSRTFRILEQERLALSRSKLITLRETMQQQMEEVINLYLLASEDESIAAISQGFSPSHVHDVIQLLQSYKTVHNFLEGIFIIPSGSDFIYSSEGSIRTSMFSAQKTSIEGGTQEITTEILSPPVQGIQDETLKIIPDLILKAQKQFEGIAFSLPFPAYEPGKGRILFLLDRESMTRYMDSLINNDWTTIFILTRGAMPIASHNTVAYDDQIYKRIAAEPGTGYGEFKIAGVSYLASWIDSPEYSWKYVMMSPASKLQQSSRELTLFVILAVVFIMLIESVLIYFLMRTYYLPMKRISDATLLRRGTGVKHRNELQEMVSSVEAMVKENDLSIPARQEFLLFNTLRGRVPSREAFNHRGRRIQRVLHYSSFCAAVVQLEKMSEEMKESVHQWLSGIKEKGMDIYVKDPLDNQTFTLLLCTDNDRLPELFCTNLLSLGADRFGVTISVGLGNLYTDFTLFGKSYIEASTALSYQLIAGRGTVLKFKEIIQDHSNLSWYSKDDISDLHYSIKRGQQESVKKIIDKLIDFIRTSGCPLFVAKCLSYDILRTVLNAIEELGYINTLPFYSDGLSLEQFHSIEELSELILNLSSDTCMLLNDRDKNESGNLKEQILEYIDEHYLDPAFYAGAMADHFKISTSYLSQFFKSNVGENLKDYINRKRIAKTKELLITTDLSIMDIVAKIGYQNVSSFSRKFRQSTGKSPRQFRIEERGNSPD